MTKYKCLVFDHDDTVVNSTATIHHPCFVEYLKEYRPGMTISLDDYFLKNFDPGFIEMCREDFNLSDEELEEEVRYWQRYVKEHVPSAYEGMKEIMDLQKQGGGYIAVISHSMKENILRDYSKNSLPVPDSIYGWEQPPERRKPNVWPIEAVMADLGLERKDLLMIDDLKPGYDMAKNAGVDFAGAGWAYSVPGIDKFMRENCENYFKTVDGLREFIFG